MAKADRNGTAQQYGHWFQDRVQQALDELMQKGPWFYQRLYDTASAGSFLPAQPADFVGASHGRPFLLEAKGSLKYAQFDQPGALRSLLKSHQALACHLYARAGGAGLIIFSSREGSLELWEGAQVREVYVTPRAQLSREPLLHSIPKVPNTDRSMVDSIKLILNREFTS